jgi:MYXO-CTERM domain-containing protein
MKKSTCLFGGALMAAGMANVAAAQFTYPLQAGPFNVPAPAGGTNLNLNLGPAVAGPWNMVSITADWTTGMPGGGSGFLAYASEALATAGLTPDSGDLAGGNAFFSDGAGNTDPQTINWSFALDTEYDGLSDLFVTFTEQFANYDYNLANVSVTLSFEEIEPEVFDLTPFSIGTLEDGDKGAGDTTRSTDDFQTTAGNVVFGTGTNETGGDDIWTLNWGGGDFEASLDIITAGVDLDLFLYDTNGDLLASAFTVDNPEIIAGSLAAGTYFLRVDGFLGDAGQYSLSITPAPGAMALMGVAGLAGFRRRRA